MAERELDARVSQMLSRGISGESLRRKMAPETRESRLASFLGASDTQSTHTGGDLGLTAGLTLGDLLWDWCRVDPMVLQGFDFASREGVSGLFTFSACAHHLGDLTDAARHGWMTRLEGYVGERVVAAHLQAAGHVVQFPVGPTEPGWDLRVDGHPFQVKCVEDPQLVLHHLARYPGIPVYAPSELHDSLADHDHVHFIPGFSHEDVQHLTQDSVQAGDDALDFEIPWVSLTVSAVRNIGGLLRGQRDLRSFLVNVGTETAGRAAGGLLGSKAGALALGLLFGPAGAVVGGFAGAVAGGVTGRHAARGVRSRLARREEEALTTATTGLLTKASEATDLKLNALGEQWSSVAGCLVPSSPSNAAVRDYFSERVSAEQELVKRRQQEMRAFSQDSAMLGADPAQQAASAMALAARAAVHPVALQDEYQAVVTAYERVRARRVALRIG